jgi:hypothetical protein
VKQTKQQPDAAANKSTLFGAMIGAAATVPN